MLVIVLMVLIKMIINVYHVIDNVKNVQVISNAKVVLKVII